MLRERGAYFSASICPHLSMPGKGPFLWPRGRHLGHHLLWSLCWTQSWGSGDQLERQGNIPPSFPNVAVLLPFSTLQVCEAVVPSTGISPSVEPECLQPHTPAAATCHAIPMAHVTSEP